MRMTLRLLSIACLFAATIGCQPANDTDVSTDLGVDAGTMPAADSNITGEAETPAIETPAVEEPAPAIEAPAEPAPVVEAPAEPAPAEEAPVVEEKPAD